MTKYTFRSTPRFNTRPMYNLFYVVESFDKASYADDTTLYVSLEDIDLINEKLGVNANEIFQWFDKNRIKANTDKCHFHLIKTNEKRGISCGGEKI